MNWLGARDLKHQSYPYFFYMSKERGTYYHLDIDAIRTFATKAWCFDAGQILVTICSKQPSNHTMLFDYNPRRHRLPRSIWGSLCGHVAGIGLLLWLCAPRYLHEMDSLHGRNGNHSAIALLSPGISAPFRAKAKAEPQDKKLHLPPKAKAPTAEPTPNEASASTENKVADATPGTQGGSLSFGLSSDHDVRIAYATFAPDPPINRAALPEWIRGDVVVEVAISDKGDVVETRVLKSLGFGLDDVIVQTLRQWRYQPARVDGRAVASKHDVYFHFPS